ncbi:hypothetical protein NECAME_13447 [Necator americanus]|uniref:Uncharacterized protein n=1 Tax=Necator americanus TaxID=51031 RepID=W2SVI1_NECAM|nr:hypothetical protein NECAME_13447 [Necator americanus]ETN73749.1 hypothetical protein NECAME_13447 [Necator americanus]
MHNGYVEKCLEEDDDRFYIGPQQVFETIFTLKEDRRHTMEFNQQYGQRYYFRTTCNLTSGSLLRLYVSITFCQRMMSSLIE